jgi:predicted nucleic acid-binding protein
VITVDASLAVKWFLNEPLSAAAGEILALHAGDIIVPDIMLVEVSGALVRNANVVKTNRANVTIALNRLETLFADGDIAARRTSTVEMRQCADLAIKLGHPLKDCIYLALAMELDCELVTCDARFAEKAKSVWNRVQVLKA